MPVAARSSYRRLDRAIALLRPPALRPRIRPAHRPATGESSVGAVPQSRTARASMVGRGIERPIAQRESRARAARRQHLLERQPQALAEPPRLRRRASRQNRSNAPASRSRYRHASIAPETMHAAVARWACSTIAADDPDRAMTEHGRQGSAASDAGSPVACSTPIAFGAGGEVLGPAVAWKELRGHAAHWACSGSSTSVPPLTRDDIARAARRPRRSTHRVPRRSRPRLASRPVASSAPVRRARGQRRRHSRRYPTANRAIVLERPPHKRAAPRRTRVEHQDTRRSRAVIVDADIDRVVDRRALAFDGTASMRSARAPASIGHHGTSIARGLTPSDHWCSPNRRRRRRRRCALRCASPCIVAAEQLRLGRRRRQIDVPGEHGRSASRTFGRAFASVRSSTTTVKRRRRHIRHRSNRRRSATQSSSGPHGRRLRYGDARNQLASSPSVRLQIRDQRRPASPAVRWMAINRRRAAVALRDHTGSISAATRSAIATSPQHERAVIAQAHGRGLRVIRQPAGRRAVAFRRSIALADVGSALERMRRDRPHRGSRREAAGIRHR